MAGKNLAGNNGGKIPRMRTGWCTSVDLHYVTHVLQGNEWQRALTDGWKV